ncbi:MAG: NFACT family protein [Thermomicrobiales bacterium]|nr:NFACT family protein [Thermomicrobiales bacterium]
MFDVLTAAAVADELSATILDGRIQRVGLVDQRTLAAEIYAGGQRHALVASADDRRPRLHLASAMPSLDTDLITPLGLLLRKYVRGGIVIGIDQPPLERLLRLSIAKRLPSDQERRARRAAGLAPDDEPAADAALELDELEEDAGEIEPTFVHLVVEIMGRHSNLILVDDQGQVMEAIKRVTPAMSRVRPVLPRRPYVPPPPIAKPDPRRLTGAAAAMLLANADPQTILARLLVESFRGISPQMAREIAYRTTGDAAATTGATSPDHAVILARETRALLEPLLTASWAPRLYRERPTESEATTGPVVAYGAIPFAYLAQTHDEEPVASISHAIALAEGDVHESGPVRHAQRRARLLATIGEARQRQTRKLQAVREQGAKAAEIDRLRQWGEAIYANLWHIRPGQAQLDVDGQVVPLDPARPAKDVAQEYFERYRNAQSAGVHQTELEADIAVEIAHLDELATLVAQAAGFAELEALAAEWETQSGSGRGAARKARPQKRPRPFLDAAGNAVFVGHTATQNELITFETAGPDDTWLHARGVGGSHVIVRWANPRLPERDETLAAAAGLAAWYSAARDAVRVEVDIARRRHVRKIRGGRPGAVTYRNERTVSVRPADERAVADVLRPPEGR